MMIKNNGDNSKVINTEVNYQDGSYIEVIPESAKRFLSLGDNEILLTTEEIALYNERIKEKTASLYDLDGMLNLSLEEIKNLINKYKVPKLPKYEGSLEFNLENIQGILANRNLDSIELNIRRGLIVKRTNLRSFPTEHHFYNNKNVLDFDRLQETEVLVNTPVLILHESLDGKWNFVVMPTYAGWVKKDDIAVAQKEDWEYFLNQDSFVVITDASVLVNDITLNMGVTLPYQGLQDNAYLVSLPSKDADGKVIKTSVTIGRDKAHIGFLPYTKRNLIIEAFKYENVAYSWGGLDTGIDCSSYIASLFKTFGFIFPRNTSDQKNSIGQNIVLEEKNPQEKLAIIDDEYLSVLFRLGHVMLYLGKLNNQNYIIHANVTDMQVSVSELSIDSTNLKEINQLVLIKK